jgi:hypothetical protein
VSRLTNSRAAISSVEMPRLRRASARSRPICFRACAAGKGREGTLGIHLISDIADAMSIIVCYIRHTFASWTATAMTSKSIRYMNPPGEGGWSKCE